MRSRLSLLSPLLLLITLAYSVDAEGASKLNLGIWLPPMTLKLPKFNMPKIKISATIKPRKNQPPLKIHLPEVSLNAKALGDDDGWGGHGGGGHGGGGYGDGYGHGGGHGGGGYGGGDHGGDSYGGGEGGGYSARSHGGGYENGGSGGYGGPSENYGGSTGGGYGNGYENSASAGYGGSGGGTYGGGYAAATNERYQRPAQAPAPTSEPANYAQTSGYESGYSAQKGNNGYNHELQRPNDYGQTTQQGNDYRTAGQNYGSRLSTQSSNAYDSRRSDYSKSDKSAYGYAVNPQSHSHNPESLQPEPTYGPTPAGPYKPNNEYRHQTSEAFQGYQRRSQYIPISLNESPPKSINPTYFYRQGPFAINSAPQSYVRSARS